MAGMACKSQRSSVHCIYFVSLCCLRFNSSLPSHRPFRALKHEIQVPTGSPCTTHSPPTSASSPSSLRPSPDRSHRLHSARLNGRGKRVVRRYVLAYHLHSTNKQSTFPHKCVRRLTHDDRERSTPAHQITIPRLLGFTLVHPIMPATPRSRPSL